MPIYKDLHSQPHHKPDDAPVVWRPSVYGILTNTQGEWFLVESVFANAWGFPGGGVEIDEEIFEGLVREFYEETGYRIRVVGVPRHVGEGRFFHEDLGFCHSIVLIFTVELADPERDEQVVNTFEDGLEIRQGRWVDPHSLKEEDVHPVFWPFIQSWQEQNCKNGYHNL